MMRAFRTLRSVTLPLTAVFALVAACGDESGAPANLSPGADAGPDGKVAPSKDTGPACSKECFGGACPTGACEPAVLIRDAGEDIYRMRVSTTRLVFGADSGSSSAVWSRPFEGGSLLKIRESLGSERTFDVEGETLTMVTSPSGIYQYDVTTGAAIGTPIKLAAGGIAPLGVRDGIAYFTGNVEGTFNPSGPNTYPLVSSPLASFGVTTERAKGIDSGNLQSILPTKDGLFFSGKDGVFRVETSPAYKKLVATGNAFSLATDGTYLYWVDDGLPSGKRALKRANLDGTGVKEVGPTKVLSVAALPDRLFYAVEVGGTDRLQTDIMVLGTK